MILLARMALFYGFAKIALKDSILKSFYNTVKCIVNSIFHAVTSIMLKVP